MSTEKAGTRGVKQRCLELSKVIAAGVSDRETTEYFRETLLVRNEVALHVAGIQKPFICSHVISRCIGSVKRWVCRNRQLL